jgi:hypothetical protein
MNNESNELGANDMVYMLPDGSIVSAMEFLEAAQGLLEKSGYYFAADIEDLPEHNG